MSQISVIVKLIITINVFNMLNFVDEPPPKEWIDSYKKGKLLPRTMKCQYLSDKKRVVVYYDYDVSRTEVSSTF